MAHPAPEPAVAHRGGGCGVVEMSRSPRRFVIEGTWSGYTSAQRQVAHRMAYSGARKRLRAWAEKTHALRYTDGTCLILSVRDCKPRERVQEVRGYRELIEDCAHYDVDSVDGFYAAREAFREKARAAAAAKAVQP